MSNLLANPLLSTLAQVSGGYLVILLTPGPNMFAIGSTAAVRGLRTAIPLCLGVASGVACLCAAAAFAPAATGWDERGGANLVGAALLAFLACSLLRRRASGGAGSSSSIEAEGSAAFGAGFLTSGTNPMTGGYFLSAFMGVDATPATRMVVVACVLTVAASFYLALAAVLSRPRPRAAALRYDRLIRFCGAAVLVTMAARSVAPLLH